MFACVSVVCVSREREKVGGHTPQTTVNQQRISSVALHGLTRHLQVLKMKLLVWLSVLLCLFAFQLTEARVIPEGVPYDEPPAVPYWPYSTSDFWNYIEYFRSIGAYNHINEMARAFFAHQPLGDTLGYETNQGHEH